MSKTFNLVGCWVTMSSQFCGSGSGMHVDLVGWVWKTRKCVLMDLGSQQWPDRLHFSLVLRGSIAHQCCSFYHMESIVQSVINEWSRVWFPEVSPQIVLLADHATMSSCYLFKVCQTLRTCVQTRQILFFIVRGCVPSWFGSIWTRHQGRLSRMFRRLCSPGERRLVGFGFIGFNWTWSAP